MKKLNIYEPGVTERIVELIEDKINELIDWRNTFYVNACDKSIDDVFDEPKSNWKCGKCDGANVPEHSRHCPKDKDPESEVIEICLKYCRHRLEEHKGRSGLEKALSSEQKKVFNKLLKSK